jgi:hypothetical protein
LDDSFLGWDRWSLDLREMYSDEEQIAACLRARAEKAGDTFKLRSMPVLSFRTYINGLAHLFKVSVQTPQAIVISSITQFPKLNAFLAPLLSRAMDKKAANWKGDPISKVLVQPELVQVVAMAEELGRPLDIQRQNILVLGYSTGYRGEVLRGDTFHLICVPDLRSVPKTWVCAGCLDTVA